MLENLWRKENPSALLVGIQTGVAIVKTVWKFLRKLKVELPFNLAIPLLRSYLKNPETPIHENLCTPMFIAAQFTIAVCWKQPKCPSANEWIKKTMVHLHHGILRSRKIKGASTLHNSMHGTGEHYCKWNKPDGERQIAYDLTYKWDLIKSANKQTSQQNRTRASEIKNKLTVTRGEVGGDNGGIRRKGFQE